MQTTADSESGRAGYLMPVGVVGGIVAFIYMKRATVYSEAAFVVKPEASIRLKILHEQSGKVSQGMREAKHKVQQASKADSSLISHIVRLLMPECWLFLGVALTAVGAAIVNLWTPVVTGDLINLFVLFFTNGLLTFAHTTLVTILGERIGMRLHTMAMNTLLSHDMTFFDSAQSGELISRLTMDIAEFQSTFKKIVTQGLKSATLSIGVLYQLIRLSPQLTMTLISTTPVAYFGLAYYGRFLRALRKQSKEWESISTGIAGEAIGNIRTVRSLSAESAELSLYKEARNEASVAHNRFGLHMGIFRGLTNMSIGTMVLTVLYNGGRLVTKGDMSPGDLMAFMIATQSAQKALDSLGSLMGQGVKARSAITRVFEVVNLTPTIPRSGGVKLSSVAGHIRFMDVDFSYPSRPDTQVLSHFNLDIPAGQVVALCGLSGSGKSTVASLLERFYDPANGEIWLDACPLAKLDPSWHRSQIGFIPQEPALFSTSIRENLRLASPQATDAQIEEACRQANAHDFVMSFPHGYDTVVGERGALLSGGQKQRLSIARAILRDPKILILDEATSSLDTESERLVQMALDRLMVGRTVLVIAHRLTTIRNADRIVVMGRVPGHIIEQGTHDELLAKKGAYYKLHMDAHTS
ncbi:hypothetical protein GGI12_003757 [Dipsacomyces acuminosporus]|nr:hypothetical protein GGI12_003757 [Dipsacomyces acuminosporus]